MDRTHKKTQEYQKAGQRNSKRAHFQNLCSRERNRGRRNHPNNRNTLQFHRKYRQLTSQLQSLIGHKAVY